MKSHGNIAEAFSDLSHLALKHSADAVIWIDASGGVYHANEAACRRFGLSSEADAGLTIFDIDANCDAALWPRLKERLKNRPGDLYETQFYSRQGDRVPVEVTCAPIEDEDLRLFALFVRDVSFCKRAEEESRGNEERLRAIVMALPDLIFVLDEEGRYLEALTSREDLLFVPVKDLRGKLLHDLFEKPLADHFLELMRDTIRNNEPGVLEYELPIGGEIHSFEARIAPLAEVIDGRKCLVLIARDITERKRAEHLHNQNIYLQEELTRELVYGDIVGTSAAMRTVFESINVVADTDATVLLLGETGTGKELIARAVHKASSRKASPLIKVNCGALPASLAESALFGHEKGAFTGAIEQKKGRFEIAHGGTIFLDEVGELPPETQIKLLRVLQEKEFERVGGNPRPVIASLSVSGHLDTSPTGFFVLAQVLLKTFVPIC
jgi:PAS domain S-box-containing protein